MKVTSNITNRSLTIYIEGRVDSSNSAEVDKLIQKICEKADYDTLILDLEKTQYLSSAGLRILLRLRKKNPSLSVINVSSDVYEILEMTGFTEMMPVTKAMRQLSIEGCEMIGQGSNGWVYRYSEDIIVKVYKNKDALEEIKREREFARKALIMGVNTAIPYDVVKVGDKYGSVFELLSAKSLSRLMGEEPENMDKYIGIFTKMLKEIHTTDVPEGTFPAIKEVYMRYAHFLKDYLDEAHYEKLVRLIEAVPDSNHMIHGDYHTNNVHYSNNEAILIDMDTLSTGNPVFEFASIFLAFKGFNELDEDSSKMFLKLDANKCDYVYDQLLKYYYEENEDISCKDDNIRLLAYTRLLRRTIRRYPEKEGEINRLKEQLEKLIEKADTLY